MRPIFLLLGVWHGMVAIGSALFGGYMVLETLLHAYGGAGTFGLILCVGGLASLPTLALAAQGGTGAKSAGALLTLPFLAALLFSPLIGPFLPLMLLPGAILGAAVMSGPGEQEG